MSIDRDNPKWTAYVLGELDASERAALESELESSEEAREFVQELRLAASMMKDGLAAHADVTLTPEQRFSIQGASSARPAKPWFTRPLAWTGVLAAAAALLAAISIPSLLRSRQVPTQPLVDSAAVQQTDKTLSKASAPPPVSAFQEDIQEYARTDKQVYRPAAKDRAAAPEAVTPPSVGVGFGAGVARLPFLQMRRYRASSPTPPTRSSPALPSRHSISRRGLRQPPLPMKAVSMC